VKSKITEGLNSLPPPPPPQHVSEGQSDKNQTVEGSPVPVISSLSIKTSFTVYQLLAHKFTSLQTLFCHQIFLFWNYIYIQQIIVTLEN